MMKFPKRFARRLYAFCATTAFFRCIVILLVVQAAWIALSGRYPMAFDEDFHLGVIRLYAHHISPFWSTQPAGADAFGAIARDPSYLYQYIMSFLYRLITVFTHNQTAIVLMFRAISIALFAASLPLFRRLLLATGAPRRLVHICLLLFVLLPVVPLLAAQINYDNLLMPLVAWMLLLAIHVKEGLQKHKLLLQPLVTLLVVCLFTSLVKYASLTFSAAIAVYLAIYTWRSYDATTKLKTAFRTGYRVVSLPTRIILIGLVILSAGLFVQRYGVNTAAYHAPIPDCDQVLDTDRCSAFGPWNRDHTLLLNKVNPTPKNPITYTHAWAYGMWYRTFFAVDGKTTGFQTRDPLLIPSRVAIYVAAAAFVALLVTARRLLRRYNTSVIFLFGLTIFFYIGSLWFDEYRAYLRTGQPVGINGRYLLPVALFIMLVGGLALYELFRKYRRLSAVITLLVVLSMAWGGGALTYILRSNQSWYMSGTPLWPASHEIQRVVRPLVPGD